MRVLVTGAGGFIGRHVCTLLSNAGYRVRGAGRALRPGVGLAETMDWVRMPVLDATSHWAAALQGIDAVVHLAGRAHVLRDRASEPLAEYRRVNVAGTEALARQAAQRGVRRIVFMSSIKVNGERTGRSAEGGWQKFTDRDLPCPEDAYGTSKWEAEKVLAGMATETGLQVTVLRPPLVYGPGVGANFLRLMHAIERGWPLPFGAVDNLRSLIYVENLADAVLRCLRESASAGRTYTISDMDVSTPGLIIAIARAMGRKPKLFRCSPVLLRSCGRVIGQRDTMQRLLDSLVVDSSAFRRELQWTPRYSNDEGLSRTVNWFLSAS